MIIVDPITLGDTSFSRPSPKWVYNRTGTLVEVPANTLGVTYDPADLSKAPWALIEPAATNMFAYSEAFDAAAWGKNGVSPVTASGIAPNGQNVAALTVEGTASGAYLTQFANVTAGDKMTMSVFAKPGLGDRGLALIFTGPSVGINQIVAFDLRTQAAFSISGGLEWEVEPARNGWVRYKIKFTAIETGVVSTQIRNTKNNGITYTGDGASGVLIYGAMLTVGAHGSYVPTTSSAVTRAADVVGSVAGLLYSNVPITEPDYNAATTYAKDALVHDPVTHNVFRSLIDANKGKALTDLAAWNPRGATNRWAMLDQYNNTQTIYPEEILIVLTGQAICEGLYIGNCDADEIELSVVDQSEGLVASSVTSMVTASGTSSYFDWCFRPANRSDYFITTSIPPYASALVLVAIRKPGGFPKCGMLAIGAVDEFGPSLYGLSAEGKDYSSVTFNFDGTTNTELRPYAKRMSVDVQVDNGEIDYIQRKLFQLRQRPIVWIGGPYGATAVFGRYGSFKIVIPGLKKSDMALQIEGSV